MYRRVLLSAVTSVALVSSAFAADIYTPSAPYAVVALPPSWAGFYLGVIGGYGGNTGLKFSEDVYYPNITPPNTYSTLFGSDTIAGGFGGGQLGYNFQFGSFVAGFETDIQGSDIQGSGAQAIFNPATPVSPILCGSGGGSGVAGKWPGVCAGKSDLDVDWFGTVRGRLGYAWGGTLIYVTGGFAYGGVNSRFSYTDNSISAVSTNAPLVGKTSTSSTQTGWVAGAGIEYKISPSWSLKGEYQYIDLGSITTGPGQTFYANGGTPIPTCPGASCLNLSGHSSDVAFNTVRVGVNYYFNAPPPPLPLK